LTEHLGKRNATILLELVKVPDGLTFNEICRELNEFISRRTVKKGLDELISLGLAERHARMRGQKVYYIYKPFAETVKSIDKDLDFLSDLLEGLRIGISRIEKKLGKKLNDITPQDDIKPVIRDFRDLLIEGFGNVYMIIYIVESRYPPRLRERFEKEIEKPVRELSDEVSRIILLSPELQQELDHFIKRKRP